MTIVPVFAHDVTISSGQPIPRFVTIKFDRTNVRIGPGKNHAISRIYIQKGFPVEITQEYGDWRKIRDFHGNSGWVNKVLLSVKRSAVVSPWERKSKVLKYINLYKNPTTHAIVIAKIEPGALLSIRECSGEWCFIANSDISGWIMQSEIWGVYPREVFK
ncbi:MAG: hypothetical protein C4617_01125 [Candidatus Liberibacter europaeus]|uniref:SH3b domain-containing protein n=1 Tax=Candidatus Liberibacter europaeus TaxID=744859 RepID=A0A2T4VZ29_9HYPH|nr:hypothetical protein [Candidatus Liberibacter europaeus]PTL87034.1 MAG: hypothetical protein C4617_01125 [Candidatus Liberibacter europaeus]